MHAKSGSCAASTAEGRSCSRWCASSRAQRLRTRLEAAGGEVYLTRERDAQLSLSERVAMTNDHGADLFICECYAHDGRIAGHMSWQILKRRLPDLRARRIMVTHMNPTMLACLDEVRAAGVLVAEDGMVIEI